MRNFVGDPRLAFLLWLALAGSVVYRFYQPGVSLLGPAMIGAMLPATVIVGVMFLAAQRKQRIPNEGAEQKTERHEYRLSSTMFATLLFVLVAVGGVAFSYKHRSYTSAIASTTDITQDYDKTPYIAGDGSFAPFNNAAVQANNDAWLNRDALLELDKESRRGITILKAMRDHMPEEYNRLPILADNASAAEEEEFRAAVAVIFTKAIHNADAKALKQFFALRLKIIRDVSKRDSSLACNIIMKELEFAHASYEVSPDIEAQIAPVNCNVISSAGRKHPLAYDPIQGKRALQQAIRTMPPSKLNAIISQIENEKDFNEKDFTAAYLLLGEKILKLPEKDAVQAIRFMKTDWRPNKDADAVKSI